MSLPTEIKHYSGQPLTRQILRDLLQEYKRPFDKLSEMTHRGELIQVKRGLFIPGPKLQMTTPENFLLANHLRGPSYVSSDSALAFWGLIPEKVYEIISVTTQPSKMYKTPVGRFRYIRLPLPYYAPGQQRVELAPDQFALVAEKEKALCDKIITTPGLVLRSMKQARDYLLEDLRIEREALREMNSSWIRDYFPDAPKKESISSLIKTLEAL